MACTLCDHTTERTSDQSHCRRCHQNWLRTTNACHCVRCCVTFGSPSASARHDPDGPCLTPEALAYEAKVNKWGNKVWWPVLAPPDPTTWHADVLAVAP